MQKIANDNIFNYDVTIRAMTELISLLTEEINYIKLNRMQSLANTFDRKVDIVKYLEAQNCILSSSPQAGELLDAEQKGRLKNLAQELQAILAKNSQELEKAKYFNEWMIKAVVDKVMSKAIAMEDCASEAEHSKNAGKNQPGIPKAL